VSVIKCENEICSYTSLHEGKLSFFAKILLVVVESYRRICAVCNETNSFLTVLLDNF